MKRYLVFAGDTYYPSGGWEDLKKSFNKEDVAVSWAEGWVEADALHWAHIVDTEAQTIIWDSTKKGATRR